MLKTDTLISTWKDSFIKINEGIFDFAVVKPEVDEWIEQNIYISESTSVRPGMYSFDFTPYMREIVKHLHPKDPVRWVSIMKDGQSGFTTALVIGGILYRIVNVPSGILFTAADINLAQKTIEERFDPILRSSRLDHYIRPNVIKKSNNKTGDTSKKKEFAGGSLTSAGTNSANTFRMFSSQINMNDDYDTAPREIGKEGSPKMVMKTRQNSFGDKAKTFMISTPTVAQTSNIYEQYQLGTQKKWNWPCPACMEFFAVDWLYKLEDGTKAGIVYELDENKKLILDSVRYKCPHCGHLIEEKEKYDLNLKGKWVATCPVPVKRRHESYQKNSIYNPPGFDGWVTLVEEWLAANPHNEPANVLLLKTFNNLRLGLAFEEMGESPRVNELMQNTRGYHPGVIPDVTCEKDGNGKIIMITLACDINGIMKEGENEDVRVDWEIVAHSSTGVTYSVDHGSIGTFKRGRDRSKREIEQEDKRMKWTLVHDSKAFEGNEKVDNSVWKPLEEMIQKIYPQESNKSGMNINISAVDTGFGEKHAMTFIANMQEKGLYVYGVKGRVEENYRKLQRDTNPVVRSREKPKQLYIVEVNQMKDDLSMNMKLREGEDGAQSSGYMNFPDPRDGKYNMRNYFSHYEGERRVEEVNKNGDVIGYKWVKKNSTVQNHFWDVRVYNLAAPLIMLDLVRQSDSKLKNMSWEEFVMMLTG